MKTIFGRRTKIITSFVLILILILGLSVSYASMSEDGKLYLTGSEDEEHSLVLNGNTYNHRTAPYEFTKEEQIPGWLFESVSIHISQSTGAGIDDIYPLNVEQSHDGITWSPLTSATFSAIDTTTHAFYTKVIPISGTVDMTDQTDLYIRVNIGGEGTIFPSWHFALESEDVDDVPTNPNAPTDSNTPPDQNAKSPQTSDPSQIMTLATCLLFALLALCIALLYRQVMGKKALK